MTPVKLADYFIYGSILCLQLAWIIRWWTIRKALADIRNEIKQLRN